MIGGIIRCVDLHIQPLPPLSSTREHEEAVLSINAVRRTALNILPQALE